MCSVSVVTVVFIHMMEDDQRLNTGYDLKELAGSRADHVEFDELTNALSL